MDGNDDSLTRDEIQPVRKRYYEEYDVELFNGEEGTSGTLAVLERVCKFLVYILIY